MDWPIGPYGTAMGALLLLTLPIHWFLTRDEKDRRVHLWQLPGEIRAKGYWWHIALYALMFIYKAFIDHHNEPMKARVGGFTHWIHAIEGDWTLSIQEIFVNDLLTDLLSAHYLFMYLFMIWFSPMYYILSRDEVMADKAALNYFIVYILSVPLYLFFNVEVTSSFIPNMDALLYHDSFTLAFFTDNDPMDNAVPSLHVGLPVGLLLINRLHCRRLGISIKDWRHREFDIFVTINVLIYLFSIQYLGIHWIVDIVPGIMLAIVTAGFVHAYQPVVRARSENGWRTLLPDKKQSIAGLLVAVICSTWLFVGVVDGAGVDEDTPNFRFDWDDVEIDTVEVHSLWDPVRVNVSNVGMTTVEVKLVKRSLVESFTEKGEIDWSGFATAGETEFIKPHEAHEFEVTPANLFDVYLVVMRIADVGDNHLLAEDDQIGQLRITPHYVDDELIWSGLLVSLPAFLITGVVIEGMLTRRHISE